MECLLVIWSLAAESSCWDDIVCLQRGCNFESLQNPQGWDEEVLSEKREIKIHMTKGVDDKNTKIYFDI